jgi:hypothetical protein
MVCIRIANVMSLVTRYSYDTLVELRVSGRVAEPSASALVLDGKGHDGERPVPVELLDDHSPPPVLPWPS